MRKEFVMNAPMKSAALQKELNRLDDDAAAAPAKIQPDITAQVEYECTRFNSRILNIRNIMQSIRADGFDASMLDQKGEKALEEALDAMGNLFD